jgi:phage-related minor tail protein
MLNRIADVFLDTAARMLANQFQQGILGLLGNIFNPFSITGGATNTALSTAQQVGLDNAMYGNTFPMGSFANGGRPPVGRPSIVGERGAELFVPDRAGTIIPNHQLGGMGGTNIVVNVDASGSNVEGDEEEGRALGIALSAAIETELIKQKRPGG